MPLSFTLSNAWRDKFVREKRRDLIRIKKKKDLVWKIIYYVLQLLSLLLEMTSRLSLTPRRLTTYSSSSLLYSAVNNIDDGGARSESNIGSGKQFFRIIVTFNRIKCSFSWSSHATNEYRSSTLKERLISQPINLRIGMLQKIRSRIFNALLYIEFSWITTTVSLQYVGGYVSPQLPIPRVTAFLPLSRHSPSVLPSISHKFVR